MASYTGGGVSAVSSPTGAAGGDLTGTYPNPTAKFLPSGINFVNPSLGQGTDAAVTTALKPSFMPVTPPCGKLTLSALAARIGTAVGGSSVGCAVYSVAYSASGTYLATRVAQLNALLNTAATTGIVNGVVTTGAAGSGAATYAMDFTTRQYLFGCMASTVTTLTVGGVAPISGMGCLSWTAAARSSVTDWPATFTQASAVANAGNRVNAGWLLNADGLNWL